MTDFHVDDAVLDGNAVGPEQPNIAELLLPEELFPRQLHGVEGSVDRASRDSYVIQDAICHDGAVPLPLLRRIRGSDRAGRWIDRVEGIAQWEEGTKVEQAIIHIGVCDSSVEVMRPAQRPGLCIERGYRTIRNDVDGVADDDGISREEGLTRNMGMPDDFAGLDVESIHAIRPADVDAGRRGWLPAKLSHLPQRAIMHRVNE